MVRQLQHVCFFYNNDYGYSVDVIRKICAYIRSEECRNQVSAIYEYSARLEARVSGLAIEPSPPKDRTLGVFPCLMKYASHSICTQLLTSTGLPQPLLDLCSRRPLCHVRLIRCTLFESSNLE